MSVTKIGYGEGIEVNGPIYVLNTSGTRVTVIDENGNIDAPITTTDLATTGNTTLGNGGGTNTYNDPNTFNATIDVGADGTGYDVNLFGATAGKKVFWDESADTLFLTCTVDVDGTITVGVDDTGYDVKFFGATTGKSWLWDESADKMIVTGSSDLLGATQVTGTLTVGVNDTGYDVTFYGATAGKSFLWDESADTLILTGDLQMTAGQSIKSSVASIVGTFMPTAVQQALSGAGAVNLTTYYTAVTNTGADALTLADSTVIGQLKKVKMIVDPGTDSTLTLNGTSTIVFADVGDYVVLLWNGADWIPVELGNDADGATAPAYTP